MTMILDKESDLQDINMCHWLWQCGVIAGDNFESGNSSVIVSDKSNSIGDGDNGQVPGWKFL
jgi:hypothetical protein